MKNNVFFSLLVAIFYHYYWPHFPIRLFITAILPQLSHVMVAFSQRRQTENHVNTSFEITWIKCDSLIQGHHRLFQASCRVKTDSNGSHMAEVSFDQEQTTQKLGKVHVNEPPAVSHHNYTIRHQEKTFVVRMKPLCL